MSVTYFHPPGCETNDEETCPPSKIREICGEDVDAITLENIRAPFLKALLHNETFDDSVGEDGKLKYPGYTRHKNKRDNDGQEIPGAGKCYNDYAVDSEGLRGWVKQKKRIRLLGFLSSRTYQIYP